MKKLISLFTLIAVVAIIFLIIAKDNYTVDYNDVFKSGTGKTGGLGLFLLFFGIITSLGVLYSCVKNDDAMFKGLSFLLMIICILDVILTYAGITGETSSFLTNLPIPPKNVSPTISAFIIYSISLGVFGLAFLKPRLND